MLRRSKQKQFAHDGICWCVQWSPSGEYLASCGQDKCIKLWRVTPSGIECVKTLNQDGSVHTRTVRRVGWRGDSSYISGASFDSTISVWHISRSGSTEHVTTLSGQESEIKGVAFSPCGDYLATCSRDKSVWIFDLSDVVACSSRDDSSNSLEEGFQQVCLDDSASQASEDREFMFASSPRVRTPTSPTGHTGQAECLAVLTGHSQDVKCVKYDPSDPSFLVSVSYDDTVRIWGCPSLDSDEWELMETLRGHTGTVWDICFKEDSNSHEFVTASADGTIKFWSIRNMDSTQFKVLSQWYNQGPLLLNGRLSQRQIPLPVQGSQSSWTCQTVHITVATDEGSSPPPLYSVDWQDDRIAVACGDNAVRVLRRGESGSVVPITTYKTNSEPNCVSWLKSDGVSPPTLAIAYDDGSIDLCELIE